MANQTLSLTDALAVIPIYDGHNISLSMFVRGCKEALVMMGPEAEGNLVKAVRIKITGEARRSIQDETFDTIEELQKYLKKLYAPIRNVHQLHGELGSIYQRDNESVSAYGYRVQDLGDLIIDSYELTNPASDQAFFSMTKASLPACFFRGLKPEIESRLQLQGNLRDLISRAVQIEKQLELRAMLRSGGRDNSCTEVMSGESNRKVLVVASEEVSCQLCDRSGHSAKHCPVEKEPQVVIPSKINHDEENLSTCLSTFPLTICQVCNKRGHTADRCYRIFPPQGQDIVNVTLVCQLCKNQGHSAINCNRLNSKTSPLMSIRQVQVPQNFRYQNQNNIQCQICRKEGHGAHICPFRNNHSQPLIENRSNDNNYDDPNLSTFEPKCNYCKQTGHFIRECPIRPSYQPRFGEPGNDDGLSRMGVPRETSSNSHTPHTNPNRE